MARPTDYTAETAAIICARLADGESLKKICADEHMPGRSTVYQWLFAHAEFADNYARARDEQADTLADEIIAIADEATDPAKARLQVDARKWVAAKLKPKKYGEKLELGSDPSRPLTLKVDAADIGVL